MLHLICDNYATHKHPKVKEWLWIAKANDVLAKVIRAYRKLSSKQNEAIH